MKHKIRQFIIASVILLTVFCLIFIFGNSLKDGTESGEQSMEVKRMLVAIADFFGIEGNINIAELRNLAHVAEFSLFGLCMGLLSLYLARRKHPACFLRYIFFVLASVGAGIFVAIIDELIQLTSAGRACEIKDVLLDTVGIIVGNILAILLYFVVIIIRKQIEKAQREKFSKNY